MEQIFCIKLASGEELIAKIVETVEQTDALQAKDVYAITLQRNGTEVAVGIIPWLVGNPAATVNISYAHIVTCYEPVKALQDRYLTEVSGIVIGR
jgi:hypothetical protein